MKKSGWLWAIGAGIVGLGAWALSNRKAVAQENPTLQPELVDPLPEIEDDSILAQDAFSVLMHDSIAMTPAELATLQQWLRADPANAADFKNEANRWASVCLPGGELLDANFVEVGGGKTVIRFAFRYLGVIDPVAAIACLNRKGV